MSATVRGDKRDALLAAGKSGHKVLIFGQKVFGHNDPNTLRHDNATIEALKFPEDFSSLTRLIHYSLVILDYAAFDVDGRHSHKQDVFEKQMEEALGAGTTFCLVHYNHRALERDFNKYSDIPEEHANLFRRTQIGFRWLEYRNIRPHIINDRILSGAVKRNVFKAFLDRWGASHNYFGTYYESKFDDVICSLNEDVSLGFTLDFFKGRLVYLPFQRDHSRPQDVLEGTMTLVDCLLTYITESLVEMPEWASSPFFKEETSILQACSELEQKLEESRALLKPFEEAKALLFQSKYDLERTIPAFIQNHLNIKTFRDEKHKEDFWILNREGQQSIIAEVKSAIKGFKKSMIYDLYNHREENALDESFPALLVVNCNLQAGSFSDKDRIIDKQDCQVAAQNNILILRVEDLVRLWEAIREEVLTSKDVYKLFLSSKGWLQVNPTLDIKVTP